jgi:hypothetical protein
MLHKALSINRRGSYLKRQLGGFLSVSEGGLLLKLPRERRLHKERRALAGLVDAYTPPNLAE